MTTSPGYLRLLHLREQTEAAGEKMARDAERFRRLLDEDAKPRAVSSFNLFQTPEPLAAEMVEALGDLPEGARVLEPSAGLGRLYRALRSRHPFASVSLVDSSADCCRELYEATDGDQGAALFCRDFLEWDAPGEFDAVVMNPPFQRGRDIRHALRAFGMLAAGGVLVGLCADGPRQNAKLRPLCASWRQLPSGSFRSEGTRVEVVMFTMRRPA